MKIEFIETPTFTRSISALLSEDEYRELQRILLEDQERGEIIKGGGGIRKLRFARHGTGKSGGIRVIYYWIKPDATILLLLAYPKSKKETLTDKEISILKNLVKDL